MEETPMAKNAVQTGQRTVVLVFASPGPVMSETNSNIEAAAKIIPGMSLLLSATQSKRDLEASQELRQRLPSWQPSLLFAPVLLHELSAAGYPGKLLLPGEAGISDETLENLNRSSDIDDWQRRYWVRTPDDNPSLGRRDYSPLSGIADALILEVNLAYGAPSDGKYNWTPTLATVTKLYRGGDLRLLWRHEDSLEDKAGLEASVEYKRQPADLLMRYQTIMPDLAHVLAASLRQNLQEAGVAPAPAH